MLQLSQIASKLIRKIQILSVVGFLNDLRPRLLNTISRFQFDPQIFGTKKYRYEVDKLARFLTLATHPSDQVQFWGLQNDHFGAFKINRFRKILFLFLPKNMFFLLFVKIIQF